MQALYQYDFRKYPPEALAEIISHSISEFAPTYEDPGFIKELIDGVLGRQAEIDGIITHYAPEWRSNRSRSWIAIFCASAFTSSSGSPIFLRRSRSTKAIELAKTFGGESSGRFVNGVLGAIFKDMVAPVNLKK